MVAIYYVMIVSALYFVILMFSFRNIKDIFRRATYSKYNTLSGSELVPSVSLLVPAYNEELTIAENVRCLMTLNYPTYEVIVINDGSSDETLKVLIEEYGLTRPIRRSAATSARTRFAAFIIIRSTLSYISLTKKMAVRRIH